VILFEQGPNKSDRSRHINVDQQLQLWSSGERGAVPKPPACTTDSDRKMKKSRLIQTLAVIRRAQAVDPSARNHLDEMQMKEGRAPGTANLSPGMLRTTFTQDTREAAYELSSVRGSVEQSLEGAAAL
jgi:hypothetical protein